MLVVISVLVIALFIVGCGGGSDTTTTSSSSSSALSSERTNFIKANVALACYMMGGEGDVMLGDEAYNDVLAPYGMTVDKLEELSSKYEGASIENEFAAEIQKTCPEAFQNAAQMAEQFNN